MKKEPMITRVAIPITGNDWNPIFNSIIVEPEDLDGGSFLKITGCDVEDNNATICLEWTEWDRLVEVVAKYRKTWSWSAGEDFTN
jgi:hypothetical protein